MAKRKTDASLALILNDKTMATSTVTGALNPILKII